MSANPKPDRLLLEAPAARVLAMAERRLGELSGIARLWEPWQRFARGPLTAWSALGEVELMGHTLDLAELVSLGPEPQPSRPVKPLRWAVGITWARRRLESHPSGEVLNPYLVTQIYQDLDAPGLARGGEAPPPPAQPIAGAAAWTLAPRWLESGLPNLWAAGLALAAWEREGPDEGRRGLAGRVLLAGLSPLLGFTPHALDRLGPAFHAAARQFPGGVEAMRRQVRREGSWRRLMLAFLAGLEASARTVAETAMAARELNHAHHDLIDTWVRAPSNPKRLLDYLLGRPVVELPEVAEALDVTQRTAGLLASKLANQGLLVEITGQKRGRRFAYAPLIELLQPGWGQGMGEDEGSPAQAEGLPA